ncbi:MAG: hypothetical protein A2036_01680 [Omnitrophica bacterium GWA2_50_21]|nr:MAG: hypothetical protein A2036_01680 [Omnitrophica bacterium GWA2_50_21]
MKQSVRNERMQSAIKIGAILFLLANPTFLFADSDPKNNETMKEVTVRASKVDSQSPFLPDVKGAKIYAGKKTSAIRLDEAPTITNNNYRQALSKTPGLLVSEESTPLFSLGYRGLDPHRAQFMQIMKDGIPIHADMFGYPEAYYTPPLQTVESIEFIRGGAALMYGPQPGGALNFVTQKPVTDRKFQVESENVFGTDNYFSNYEAFTGTAGPVGYLGYFHEREGDGFRAANSDFEVISSGMKVTINQTGDTRLTLNYDEYHEEHGEPGGLSLTSTTNPTYEADRSFATRQFDRFRLERYYASAILEHDISDATLLEARLYGGNYRRYSKRQRGGGFGTIPTGGAANSNDIEEQDFYNLGFEPRLRHDYELLGEKHTLTVGTHTFFSESTRTDQRGASASADSGAIRNESDRSMEYFSVFLENLFRWKRLSVTPSVRFEHFWQRIEEHANATRADLIDRKTFDVVPLFGIGVVYEAAKAVEVYTNFSQSYRPEIFTQSVPTGTNQVVNEDLHEGFGWQYDIGLRGRPLPFLSWDTSFFILDFKDQIGTVGNTVQNVGDARHYGVELFTEADLIGIYDFAKRTEFVKRIGSFSPFVSLTLLDAEFYEGPSSERQPQYAPKYNLRTGVNYEWRQCVKINMSSTFVGDHFADDASTLNRKIPSYKVWDLTGEVKLFRNLWKAVDMSLFGGINNLFDEKYYSRIRGDGIDPAYGRNLYGGVKFSIGSPSKRLGEDSVFSQYMGKGYAG